MHTLDSIFFNIGRLGMGAIFLYSVVMDIKSRPQLFALMQIKKVPYRWLFFIGALTWKTLTSIGLIFNVYTFWSASLLSLYIFIANIIFNNFWAVPKEQRDFTLVFFLTNLAACFGLLAISAG